MLRIDQIYARKDMISDALGYTFDLCLHSDHDLVSVKFNCKQTFVHGPGLWKFNFSLTQDDDYTGLLLWQGTRLLLVENNNFPCFSVYFTFQHEIWY